MGNPKAFLTIPRKEAGYRPIHDRILDFSEVEQTLNSNDRRQQASRCMDCGVPFCHWACPLGNKAVREELKYGCAFAAVSGMEGDARIHFYSPNCAVAHWNAEKGRIRYGFAFEDTRKDESDIAWTPEHVTFYTDTDIWELDRTGGAWTAVGTSHDFGEPLMVAFVWDATHDKPFGQSRLKKPIRNLIQGYIRTVANATIGLEFATSPQKYLLGVSDDQYDTLVSQKFKQYVGSILYSTINPDTGEKPEFGQLSQGSIEPHVQMLRMLATQFSAATGLTVTDTGVVNDANPTSTEPPS